MKQVFKNLAMIMIMLTSVFLIAQTGGGEGVPATEGVPSLEGVASGMQWVSFLTPFIVLLATYIATAVKKLPSMAILMIVTALSASTGYIMEMAGATDNWIMTSLLGLASVFMHELRKAINKPKTA